MAALSYAPPDIQKRIEGEYLEMPGLILSVAQAQRLWGLDRRSCEQHLFALVRENFLRCTPDGRYVLADRSAA
jgi:DNA-binding IclR family transcriptional regulator